MRYASCYIAIYVWIHMLLVRERDYYWLYLFSLNIVRACFRMWFYCVTMTSTIIWLSLSDARGHLPVLRVYVYYEHDTHMNVSLSSLDYMLFACMPNDGTNRFVCALEMNWNGIVNNLVQPKNNIFQALFVHEI